MRLNPAVMNLYSSQSHTTSTMQMRSQSSQWDQNELCDVRRTPTPTWVWDLQPRARLPPRRGVCGCAACCRLQPQQTQQQHLRTNTSPRCQNSSSQSSAHLCQSSPPQRRMDGIPERQLMVESRNSRTSAVMELCDTSSRQPDPLHTFVKLCELPACFRIRVLCAFSLF